MLWWFGFACNVLMVLVGVFLLAFGRTEGWLSVVMFSLFAVAIWHYKLRLSAASAPDQRD